MLSVQIILLCPAWDSELMNVFQEPHDRPGCQNIVSAGVGLESQ